MAPQFCYRNHQTSVAAVSRPHHTSSRKTGTFSCTSNALLALPIATHSIPLHCKSAPGQLERSLQLHQPGGTSLSHQQSRAPQTVSPGRVTTTVSHLLSPAASASASASVSVCDSCELHYPIIQPDVTSSSLYELVRVPDIRGSPLRPAPPDNPIFKNDPGCPRAGNLSYLAPSGFGDI